MPPHCRNFTQESCQRISRTLPVSRPWLGSRARAPRDAYRLSRVSSSAPSTCPSTRVTVHTMTDTNTTQAGELERVAGAINAVQEEIKGCEQKIEDAAARASEALGFDTEKFGYWSKKEEQRSKNLEQLRKKEEQLRKKEEQLRKKEEQLREEKMLLLQRQAADSQAVKKFKIVFPDKDQPVVWKASSTAAFDALLARNHVNLFARDQEDETPLEFDDIVPATDGELRDKSAYSYEGRLVGLHKTLDDANNKTRAWTDSIEAEAGIFLEERGVAANEGLYHESHRFQVWAKHMTEDKLRERDGLFFFPEDDTVLLVSAKARFREKHLLDLFRDVSVASRFNLEEWQFMAKDKKLKTMLDLRDHYPMLQGRQVFSHFVGVGVSPLFSPDIPTMLPERCPRIFCLNRRIPHVIPAMEALPVLARLFKRLPK